MTNVDTNKTYIGVTDKDGKYSITTNRSGKYKISLQKKSYDTITKVGTGDGVVNEIDPATQEAKQFELTIPDNKEVVDAGVYRENATLEINKTDEVGQALKAVVYELLNTLTNEKLTATTNADGVAIFEGLEYDTLYSLIEKSAPEGYFVPETKTDIFATLDNSVIKKDFENRIIKSDVDVTVVDKDDNTVLKDARVTLQRVDADGKPVGEPIEKTTGAEGKVSFTDVEYGKYQIKQITTATGYVVNDTPIDIEVKTDGETISKTIENDKVRADVEVTVVEKDAHEIKLEGAKVKLEKIEKPQEPQDPAVRIMSRARAMFTPTEMELYTDANGIALFEKVPFGEYKITQIETIEGYIIFDGEVKINVDKNGEVVKETIENEKIRGNLEIFVYDKNDPTKMLKGAKVRIMRADGRGEPLKIGKKH